VRQHTAAKIAACSVSHQTIPPSGSGRLTVTDRPTPTSGGAWAIGPGQPDTPIHRSAQTPSPTTESGGWGEAELELVAGEQLPGATGQGRRHAAGGCGRVHAGGGGGCRES